MFKTAKDTLVIINDKEARETLSKILENFEELGTSCIEKAFKEGYEQAQDDYDIVTERDPGYKYLTKIFENKKRGE